MTLEELRKLNYAEFEKIANKILEATFSDIKKMARSRTLPALQVGLARGLIEDFKRSECKTLDAICDRIGGKST